MIKKIIKWTSIISTILVVWAGIIVYKAYYKYLDDVSELARNAKSYIIKGR